MACSTTISSIEVLVAADLGRRWDWTNEEKIRIVEESLQGFRQGSAAARRYGLSRSLLTRWRREHRSGLLSGPSRQAFVALAISPPEPPPCTVSARPMAGVAVQITVELVNGRLLTIPATLDLDVLPVFCQSWTHHDRVSGRSEGVDRGRCDGHALRHEQLGAEDTGRAWPRSSWRRGVLLLRSQGRSDQGPVA
jgi:transposase